MAKQDYYELLGVSRTASADDLKKAYRKLAMQYHPDRNPGDAAAELKFKEISEAYDVLRDDDKRAAYDRFGHAAFEGGGRGGAGGAGGGFDFNFASGFADIFDEVFGEFMGGGRRGGGATSGRGSALLPMPALFTRMSMRSTAPQAAHTASAASGAARSTAAAMQRRPSPCTSAHNESN